MSIDVDTTSFLMLSCRLPYRCSPLPKGVCERLRSSSVGEMGKESLGVSIAIRSPSACQKAKGLVGVATQVSRPAQANGIEKE
jgi:hypothetical protein